MTEIITCPTCQRKLQVPESYYGQTVQCPECRQQFVADPHTANVTAPPPVPAPPPEEDRPRRRRRFTEDSDYDDDSHEFHRIRQPTVGNRGAIILAMGLLALVLFPFVTFICGPMAWTMGNSDLMEIRAGRMDPSGEGLAQAGRILGMISTLLLLFCVALFCGLIGLASFAG